MNFKEALAEHFRWLEMNNYAGETIRSRRTRLQKFTADMSVKRQNKITSKRHVI